MTKTKQAVNQQSIKTIEFNGTNAAFLVPEHILTDQKLAVVDEGVLERLKKLLKSADIGDIMAMFQIKMKDVHSLESWVALLSNELAFHKTVNMLDTYFDPTITIIREKPFNVEEIETLEQMIERSKAIEESAHKLMAEIMSHPDYKPEEPKKMTFDELQAQYDQMLIDMTALKSQMANHPDNKEPQLVVKH